MMIRQWFSLLIQIKRLILSILCLFVIQSTINPQILQAQSPLLLEDQLIVDEIRIEGNVRSEEAAIRSLISQQVGQTFNKYFVRKDIQQIFNMGYYQDIQVEWLGEGNRWILIYRVKEKASVRAIRFEGNEEISADDITEVVDIKPFSILDLAKVKRNALKIKDLYVEKSFFLAEVNWDIVEAPDNQMDIVFRIQEKQEVKVAQVKIVGNHHVETALFKQRMATQEEGMLSFISSAGSFKTENFERDRMVILQTYYEQGYMQARVGQHLVELSPDKKKVYITIPVEEGARFKFGGIDFTGDLLFSKEELNAPFEIKAGDWFNSIKFSMANEKVGDLYKDKGYAYVNLSPHIRLDEKTKTVSVDMEIVKGPIVKIGQIEILGNTTTRDKVIRREMRIYEGDEYSSELLKRSERLITRLGFFETVKIETAKNADPRKMDLIIRVKEKPTGTFQVGAGFSSLESFIGQAQIAQNNLFGRGQSLSLNATFSKLRTLANIRFAENYLFDTRIQFAANVYRFDTYYFNFIRKSLGGNLTFGYPITDDLSLSMTYTMEEVSAKAGGFGARSSTSRPAVSGLLNSAFTSSMRLAAFYDTRNNRIFPSSGIFTSFSLEEASPYLGSQNEFTRLHGFFRYYFDLGLNMVFKINTDWGAIYNHTNRDIPIFERYFIGGPLSMRGFFRNSLGPQISLPTSFSPDSASSPFTLGGTEQMFFNLEYEFPIFQQVGIRGVGFFDGGNAFVREQSYDEKLKQFRFAWGFGIRWFSPMGPLRFEWGFPIDPKANERSPVFEFSIGNFF